MKAKLRLGPLPRAQQVKLTISVSSELKQRLDLYAELHSHANGERNDIERLIPYMLETFIGNDRAFRVAAHRSKRSGDAAAE